MFACLSHKHLHNLCVLFTPFKQPIKNRKPESLALVTEVEEFLEDMLAGVGCTQASADAEIVSVYVSGCSELGVVADCF